MIIIVSTGDNSAAKLKYLQFCLLRRLFRYKGMYVDYSMSDFNVVTWRLSQCNYMSACILVTGLEGVYPNINKQNRI